MELNAHIELIEKNRNQSHLVSDYVPEDCTKQPCIFGIDEAGRGPVLGPMIYAGFFIIKDQSKKLSDFGVNDSKAITKEKREEIVAELAKQDERSYGAIIHALSPLKISNAMLDYNKYNLNALSHDTAIGIIKHALDQQIKIADVFVDTVGDPQKYQDKILSHFPMLSVTVSKKADAIYPVVGAASICAKVVRDRILEGWKFPEGLDIDPSTFGSGYTSDGTTRSFLKKNVHSVFGFPTLVRMSWSTAADIMDSESVKVRWIDDDEEDDTAQPITKFFDKDSTETRHKDKVMTRCQLFTDRMLSQVVDF